MIRVWNIDFVENPTALFSLTVRTFFEIILSCVTHFLRRELFILNTKRFKTDLNVELKCKSEFLMGATYLFIILNIEPKRYDNIAKWYTTERSCNLKRWNYKTLWNTVGNLKSYINGLKFEIYRRINRVVVKKIYIYLYISNEILVFNLRCHEISEINNSIFNEILYKKIYFTVIKIFKRIFFFVFKTNCFYGFIDVDIFYKCNQSYCSNAYNGYNNDIIFRLLILKPVVWDFKSADCVVHVTPISLWYY